MGPTPPIIAVVEIIVCIQFAKESIRILKLMFYSPNITALLRFQMTDSKPFILVPFRYLNSQYV